MNVAAPVVGAAKATQTTYPFEATYGAVITTTLLAETPAGIVLETNVTTVSGSLEVVPEPGTGIGTLIGLGAIGAGFLLR